VREETIGLAVRAELGALRASGYSRLRAAPATATWRAVDHIAQLPADRLEHLVSVLQRLALHYFLPAPAEEEHPSRTRDPEYAALGEAMVGARSFDWKYSDVRSLRMILGALRSGKPAMAAPFLSTPPEVLRRAEAIAPIKAPDVRKLMKAAFKARFAASVKNDAVRGWVYSGCVGALEFELAADFGGWYQLRYEVAYNHVATGIATRMLNYERLLCGATGGWDYLTADNAEAAIGLLADQVEWLVRIPERALAHGGRTMRSS
jgi:hypothetical protein